MSWLFPKIRIEDLLLCQACSPRPITDDLRLNEARRRIDWKYVELRLQQYPFANAREAVWTRWEEIAELTRPPSSVSDLVEAAKARAAKVALPTKAGVETVLNVLDRAGLAPIALKGAALLLRELYPWGDRGFKDLDVLLKQEQLEEAERLLLERGLTCLPEHARNRQRYIECHHHLPPLHLKLEREGQLFVELQWNISGCFTGGRFAEEVRAKSVPTSGGLGATPSLEYLFVHCVTDIASHRFVKGVKVYGDLVALSSLPELSFSRVSELLQRHRLTVEANVVLQALERLMGPLDQRDAMAPLLSCSEDLGSIVAAGCDLSLFNTPDEHRLKAWRLIARKMLGKAQGSHKSAEPWKQQRAARPLPWRIVNQLVRIAKSLPQARQRIRDEASEILLTEWMNQQQSMREAATAREAESAD